MIIESNGKYKIIVNGVYMTELIEDKWHECQFDTKEEAEQTEKTYNEFWTK